jgi:hypothetical protein
MAIDQERIWPPGSTPPKSAGRIRKTLKAIVASDPPPAGPLQMGLGKADWIIVATLRDPFHLTELLRRKRIDYATEFQNGRWAVSVRVADRSLAAGLVTELQRTSPRKPSNSAWQLVNGAYHTAVSVTVLGGIVAGGIIGAIATLALGEWAVSASLPAWGALVGFIVGAHFAMCIAPPCKD